MLVVACGDVLRYCIPSCHRARIGMVSQIGEEDGCFVTMERGEASGFQTPLIDVPCAIIHEGPHALCLVSYPLTRYSVLNDFHSSNELF